MVKKFFSALFSLLIIVAIGAAIFFNQQFLKVQIFDKIKGMYYVHKGDIAYKELKMNKAIKYYNKGVKLYPGHYGAWYNLGNIYVAYEDYVSALYSYSQAFKHNPRMMIARMNYGIVATQKMGDFDAALKQFNAVIKTKRKLLSIPYIFDNKVSTRTNKAIAYYNIGVTYRLKSLFSNNADWEYQRKYLAKAISAYKKSLKIDSKRYDTLYNLGLAYHLAERFNDAGINYCKAIRVQPMSYEAHYNLAVLLRRLRHYQEAYEEIEKAATLITALSENTAQQQYVAIVLNDIMRSLYGTEEYQRKLKQILDEEKNKSEEKLTKEEIKLKEKEKKKQQKKKKKKRKGKKGLDYDDDEDIKIESQGVNLVNGKVVVTEDLDEAIKKNFGKCPSMHIFLPDDDE